MAPSQALADEYRAAGMPPGKLRVVDYGFRRAAPAPRAPDRRLRLGFVGTLVWHKGVHVLIEALQGLPTMTVELKVFGSLEVFPAYVKTLREQARDLPVRFMGPFDQDRAQDVYSQIDVLVVPSLWPENSPLVIHEAFMAGVPIVGARQGGIPELVSDGVNGLIYDAYSPDVTAGRARAARSTSRSSCVSSRPASLPSGRSRKTPPAGRRSTRA